MSGDGHPDPAEPRGRDDDELRRLRGENEQLRSAVELAGAAARAAEEESGRLRGTIAELQVQLIRARQDQEGFQTWGARQRLLELKERVERRVGALRTR